MIETYDALKYIYDHLTTNLNTAIKAEGLKEVAKIYRGLKPIEQYLIGGYPVIIIFYAGTNNINDNYDAWQAQSEFNIMFKYPMFLFNEAGSLENVDDYTSKYAGILLKCLTSIQFPNSDLKMFQIRNAVTDKPELNGDVYWLGFNINCIMEHYFNS